MTNRRKGHAPRHSDAGNRELGRGTCRTCGLYTDLLWVCLICKRRTGSEVDWCRRHFEAHVRTFHNQARG